MRKGQESQSTCDDDPGAIIARALRQKFSNRVFKDSPGEIEVPFCTHVQLMCERVCIHHMLHVCVHAQCRVCNIVKNFVRLAHYPCLCSITAVYTYSVCIFVMYNLF